MFLGEMLLVALPDGSPEAGATSPRRNSDKKA
jgi:hypothetical protein